MPEPLLAHRGAVGCVHRISHIRHRGTRVAVGHAEVRKPVRRGVLSPNRYAKGQVPSVGFWLALVNQDMNRSALLDSGSCGSRFRGRHEGGEAGDRESGLF